VRIVFVLLSPIFEVICALYRSFGVWAYVFSPGFRRYMHTKWAQHSKIAALYDVVLGVLGLALSILIVGVLSGFIELQ